MKAPQLSARNKRARDVAHKPRENAADFLKRMRASAPPDDEAIVEAEALIDEHRWPHLVDPMGK